MEILITGGAGFIGSNLAIKLKEKNHTVTIFDDMSSGNIENIKNINAEVIIGDISEYDFLSKFKSKKFDHIFHMAAITDTTFNDEERMFKVNVNGFKNILNFAESTGTNLTYASSAGVYGRGEVPMREDQKLAPLNLYSLSKKIIDEIVIKRMEQMKIKVVGLRYFNVYGPREKYKGKSASMIYQLATQMKEGKRPRIFKYGQQRRDFIYIEDVTRANIMSIDAKESFIINIGTGVSTSFNEIINILNKLLGTDYEPDYFDNPYGFYQDLTQADTSLAYKKMKFKAEYNIEAGIKDYLLKWV